MVRLKDGKYDTKQAFQKDVQLIFSNCEKYNKPGQLSGVFEARRAAFPCPSSSVSKTAQTELNALSK